MSSYATKQKCAQAIFQTGPISTFPKDSSFNTTTRVGSAVADLSWNPVETGRTLGKCFMCVCFFQLFQDVRAIPSFQCLKTPFVFNMASIIVGIGCRSEMVAGMAMVGSQVGSGRVRPHVLVQCFWINVLWN